MASVLIADDVPAMRDLIRQILESSGHRVTQATNGLEVIEILSGDTTFDLILLDIAMPGLSGLEALERIRKAGIELPKVCFVTGSKEQETVLRALKAGGSDFIVKPIDILIFKDKMAKLLGGTGESVATITADAIATIPRFPIPVTLRILKLSELGLLLGSDTPFMEGANFTLSCSAIDRELKEPLFMRCLVQTVELPTDKCESYRIQCQFIGFHEVDREKIRQITTRGRPLRDEEAKE